MLKLKKKARQLWREPHCSRPELRSSWRTQWCCLWPQPYTEHRRLPNAGPRSMPGLHLRYRTRAFWGPDVCLRSEQRESWTANTSLSQLSARPGQELNSRSSVDSICHWWKPKCQVTKWMAMRVFNNNSDDDDDNNNETHALEGQMVQSLGSVQGPNLGLHTSSPSEWIACHPGPLSIPGNSQLFSNIQTPENTATVWLQKYLFILPKLARTSAELLPGTNSILTATYQSCITTCIVQRKKWSLANLPTVTPLANDGAGLYLRSFLF